ncbi:recombinase family protein [Tabrizicola soli]|uniref:Recombinase family protein n=1 Tax=Tabrizicola soli TaxID=2185115 RepID=A0ABV7DSL9_9RHOB|nr:recombinase family protein [Tabrizicola soli]
MSPGPTIRCAIYTRKSSEEGLDQAFNSLDAQREACAAFIASQRHEGWTTVPERFDDGGLSGGTLERPALQRLLAEIEAGRIGMVVVYKIDRLTRSLADFVRLVEKLDARGCSFVSVTQAFNTSSSMGRLTLNVLLSFAQFEREVTAERIRDKIAASKAKGLWMGGPPPLGYDRHSDPQRRELVVNEAEAMTVRQLFDLYLRHGNLRLVEDEAMRLGLRPKQMARSVVTASGEARFSRGQLHYLLTNPVYIGRIRHKDRSYAGQHAAIIDAQTWDAVQAKLIFARARPRCRTMDPVATASGVGPGIDLQTSAASQRPAVSSSAARPLTGKLRDEAGDPLTPTHAQRHGRRFAYYTSHRLIAGGTDPTGWRLPAPALETAVRSLLVGHLRKLADQHRLLAAPDAQRALLAAGSARRLLQRLTEDASAFATLILRGELGRGTVKLSLDARALSAALDLAPEDLAPDVLGFTAPLTLARRGIETRIVAGEALPAPDATLIRVLAEARNWAKALREGVSLTELAARTGHSEPYMRTRIQLAFLSPRLQQAILEGRQPPGLTVAYLVREPLPLDWDEQQRRLAAL